MSLHSMLRGVARGWPLLAKYGCAPPWKVFFVFRRELFVDRRRARQRSSRLLLRKGNVFKLLVPPS